MSYEGVAGKKKILWMKKPMYSYLGFILISFTPVTDFIPIPLLIDKKMILMGDQGSAGVTCITPL